MGFGVPIGMWGSQMGVWGFEAPIGLEGFPYGILGSPRIWGGPIWIMGPIGLRGGPRSGCGVSRVPIGMGGGPIWDLGSP